MKPRPQTVALAAIGIADLISTLFFIGIANAAEANPLMSRILQWGPAAFVQAKLLLLIVPLVILELARRRNPIFVARAVNAAIVAYIALYTVGVAHLNRPPDSRLLESGALRHSDLERQRLLMGLPPRPPIDLLHRDAAWTTPRAPYVTPASPTTASPVAIAGVEHLRTAQVDDSPMGSNDRPKPVSSIGGRPAGSTSRQSRPSSAQARAGSVCADSASQVLRSVTLMAMPL